MTSVGLSLFNFHYFFSCFSTRLLCSPLTSVFISLFISFPHQFYSTLRLNLLAESIVTYYISDTTLPPFVSIVLERTTFLQSQYLPSRSQKAGTFSLPLRTPPGLVIQLSSQWFQLPPYQIALYIIRGKHEV